MSCKNAKPCPACYTDADGNRTTVCMNTVYNSVGAIHAIYYTDDAGGVLDTSTGTVAVGACPVASPDVEWEPLCDKLANGDVVQFLRRSITSFDATGAVIDPVQVDDFELDKVTAYTVAGEVGKCPICEDEEGLGLITDLSLL